MSDMRKKLKSPKGNRSKTPVKGGRNYKKKNAYKSFRSLKEGFVDVFERLGGSKGLYRFVKKSQANQRMFYKMIGKMLPKEMVVSSDISPESLPFVINIEKQPQNNPK